MKHLLTPVFAVGLLLTGAPATQAALNGTAAGAAIAFTNPTGASTGDYTMGWSFTVGASPITVTHLGFWDARFPTDGLAADHQVALYELTNPTALRSVTVPAGTGTLRIGDGVDDGSQYAGYYRYEDITDVTLTPGQTYVIAGYLDSENPAWPISPYASLEWNPNITLGPAFYKTGGLTNPAISPTGTNADEDRSANFLIAIPEPASLTLLAASSAVMLRRRRANA